MIPKLFRDPVHNIISLDTHDPCDRVLIGLIGTPEVQRLRHIRQLGLANLVYPGAEHSRFTHSLGVTHLARRIIDQVAGAGADPAMRLRTLAAALLHDIGHGPFSHAIEKVTQIDHEEIGVALLLDPDSGVHAVLSAVDPTLPAEVAAMIKGEGPRTFYRDVVSSQLDADRLDYILRDGLATGVKIGVYDLERILTTLEADPHHLLINSRAKEAVEGYLMARFHMYKQIYLHKAVRSAEKMLEAALGRAAALLREAPGSLAPVAPALGGLLRGERVEAAALARLDDADVHVALKAWAAGPDPILAELSGGLVGRRLFKTLALPRDPARAGAIVAAGREVARREGCDPEHHLLVDRAEDTPYRPYEPGATAGQKPIMLSIEGGQGRIEDHSDIVHLLGRDRYEVQRICFPERLRPALLSRLQREGLIPS